MIFNKFQILILVIILYGILVSCGSNSSLQNISPSNINSKEMELIEELDGSNFQNSNNPNIVTYALINVNDSLSVSGMVVDEDANEIEIAIGGALKKYNKNKVKSLQKYKRNNPELLQADIVKNTSNTASLLGLNTLISLATIIIGIAAFR